MIFKHYKGGLYKFITLAVREQDGVCVVVYRSEETGQTFTRSAVEFFMRVRFEDENSRNEAARFEPFIDDKKPIESNGA